MDEQVNKFFQTYETANASSNVSAIGDLYADTFMFGDPNGVQPVRKEDFLKVIPVMKARYASLGVVQTELHSVTTTPLDSKYLSATVAWRIKLQSPANKYVDASATYILARQPDNTLSIILQLDHQHLATVLQT